MGMPWEGVSFVIQPRVPETCKVHPIDLKHDYINHRNNHQNHKIKKSNIKDSHTEDL